MNRLYIIITVDVEDSQRPAVVFDEEIKELKQMIYGEINNQYFGFPKILEICNSYNIKATFFISVFDSKKYGENSFKTICQVIKENGHDVQLHTHPRRAYDKTRREMYLYSLDEQIEIIREGKELIKEWTGEYPIAHRAGAYGLNENTLVALKENNIPIDSSMFYSHPNCKVTWTRNKILEKNGIIEVPVTVFYRDICWGAGPLSLKIRRSFVKTDIDWASLDELKSFVKEAKKHNIRVMNLFMHSYSFIRWDSGFTNFRPDYADIEKFVHFLEFIKSDREIAVITMREFYDLYKKNPGLFNGADHVPLIRRKEPFRNPIYKAVKKVLK